MIRRLLQQLAGGSAGRRPARAGRRRGRTTTGGTGARLGSTVERYLRSRR